MKKLSIAILMISFSAVVQGQEPVGKKWFNHYVGVQANQLLRQLINLNVSNAPVSNPYLFTYALISTKCSWGIQAGVGYNYQHAKDKLSPSNQDSKISDAFYRFGIVHQFVFGKKWEASAGLDYVGSYQSDKTFTFLTTEFGNQMKDSSATVSTSLIKSKGEGLVLRLSYHLSEHILLATESTFYVQDTETKNSVLNSDTRLFSQTPEDNVYTLSATNSNTENTAFIITIPVAIFLTIKF